ncbi:MAG: alpha/beta hydrolase family protein, partial [Solimonas sp.]
MPYYRCAAPALLSALLLACCCAQAAPSAAPPPVEAFTRLPDISAPALSPDGGTIAYITSRSDAQGRGVQVLMTLDTKTQQARALLSSDADTPFRMNRCDWANARRLLCRFSGTTDLDYGFTYGTTRLVAVDADGGKVKVLIQNGRIGQAQIQDRILDWTPDDPDHVLIQLDDDKDGLPAIFELNVNSGSLRMRDRSHWPIRNFVTDGRGNARIGTGFAKDEYYYFARLDGDREWRRLEKFKAFEASKDVLEPLAVVPGTNTVYATGNHDGRDALWTIDLEDKKPPELLAHHPRVDISEPLFAPDGRLIGIEYETDKPAVYYVDGNADAIVKAAQKLLPDTYVFIVDSTQNESVYLLGAYSDVDGGRYYRYDTRGGGTLQRLGVAYPELDPATLGRMQPISYPARDGTKIPGYLTVPPGSDGKNLPLIVMPHGGPIYRDRRGFDPLLSFLVSRGYAVLQMNFRGSSGYGRDWFYAAHQDWGGLSYDDVTDGARWAIAQGIADPRRVAIVGWSFGGYIALLGATR